MANWPVYVLGIGVLGMVVGLMTFVVGMLRPSSRLTLPGLGLMAVSAVAGITAFSSPYWKKAECYLPSGELDESREECRFRMSFDDL